MRLIGLVATLAALMTVAPANAAKHCGQTLIKNEGENASLESTYVRIQKLFENIEDYSALAAKELNFSGEGYCSYNINGVVEKNPLAEVVKPAYFIKKDDRAALFVSNSYAHFSEFPLVCQARVGKLREEAESSIASGAIQFSKKEGVYTARAADESWSLEQRIQAGKQGIIVKAKAENKAWQGTLHCQFANP